MLPKLYMLNILIPTTKERRPRLDKLIQALREVEIPYILCIYENMDGGWVKATRNMLLEMNPTSLCLILGDDCLPEKGAIEILYNKYVERFPDCVGLAQPEDDILHGSVATFPMAIASNILKYLHYQYHHNYADQELTEWFKSMGKYLYVPESVIHHQHWTNGAERDNTYKLQENYYQHDADLFNSREHLWKTSQQ